ncbi:hypothetical protein H3H54_15425 [Brachybacterium sp. Z12]|uniref:hypothetical protein n=1 Tax=Brachybacterium sp. Z12 TaxID=2759167 RepID=UPI00185FE735|nr:hypothetical protein [Brachybacterium sp. Z12]QNN82378.1 hypothetical protein H3H54_15425 [Brachybacterium sp. Z12]
MAKSWDRRAGALMTRKQWLDAGAHSRDLAGPALTKVFPGFHMLSDHPASVEAMAWTLQNKVLPGSVISHTTAALLWDVPLPLQLEDKVALLRVDEYGRRRSSPLSPVSAGASLRTGAVLPVIHARVPQGRVHRRCAVRRSIGGSRGPARSGANSCSPRQPRCCASSRRSCRHGISSLWPTPWLRERLNAR